MTSFAWLQLGAYLALLLGLGVPLGHYMARVYTGEARLTQRILGPVERVIYRLLGIDPGREMGWREYALAVLAISVVSLVAVYAIQRLQGVLPLNPAGLAGVPAALAFNTAVSFVSNTNWQSYGGETTHEPPDPDDGAHGAELRVGRGRHGGARGVHPRPAPPIRVHARQRVGGYDPRRALRAAPARGGPLAPAGVAGRGADHGGLPRGDAGPAVPGRLDRRHHPGHRRRARPPARWPSSNSAPTAAGSSTSIRRIPSRTRLPSATCSSCWPSS